MMETKETGEIQWSQTKRCYVELVLIRTKRGWQTLEWRPRPDLGTRQELVPPASASKGPSRHKVGLAAMAMIAGAIGSGFSGGGER